MADTDWSEDVKKYVPDADDNAIAGIVRHCGIALQSRDASLVSFTDKSELERVREKFLKKKLGLSMSDDELDGAIAKIGALHRLDPFQRGAPILGRVGKDHPCSLEAYTFKPHPGPQVIDTPLGRIGVAICYDNSLRVVWDRLLAEGCTRFENHIVEAPDN